MSGRVIRRMTFNLDRLQRYRRTSGIRALFSENHISPSDLIMPIFISESLVDANPISAMPGLYQQSFSSLLDEVTSCVSLGIRAIILFGIPAKKDALAVSAFDSDGVIQISIKMIKDKFPDLIVIADCCLCEYTDHGHCGIAPSQKGFGFDVDKTLDVLSKIAVSYARSGVDIIAPSGMIDQMIYSLRLALDEEGFGHLLLMSYAVKFASAFYGPFREAAGSGDVFQGDRLHHQLSSSQYRESLREAELDVVEGADMLMVKPGMPYLDMIRSLRDRYDHPIVAYQVSGEYSMIQAGIEKEVFSENQIIKESLMGFKRAGSDLIISYFSKRYLESL